MNLARPLLALPPETAHRVAMGAASAAARLGPVRRLVARACTPPARPCRVLGRRLRNPIGLAAGFDKDGRYLDALEMLGFGFVEVGSVTLEPSTGAPPPRLFRLPADRALVNRMGLPSAGVRAVAARLQRYRAGRGGAMALLVNVAPPPRMGGDVATLRDAMVAAALMLAPVADAIVLNVACPNTPEGRALHDPDSLVWLVEALRARLAEQHGAGRAPVPLLVKLSPDASDAAIDEMVDAGRRVGVTGWVAVNTTRRRPPGLRTPARRLAAIGEGGLSGPPLRPRAIEVVARVRRAAGPEAVVVGVGGIATAADVAAFAQAGADLVEVFTGFVYGGPTTVRRLAAGWPA